MTRKKIFLASSSELAHDRRELELFLSRKNNDWYEKGIFLELVIWENFLDAISQSRLQDEYNKAIKECDIFLMLFFTKVGKYTAEEFETAFGQFKETNKPFIFTYFKDAEIKTSEIGEEILSLFDFKKRLASLGHFFTIYSNSEELQLKFNQQLEKLVANGFIRFSNPSKKDSSGKSPTNTIKIKGDSNTAIQGPKKSTIHISQSKK